MKKFIVIIVLLAILYPVNAQNSDVSDEVEQLMKNGEFGQVIGTCLLLLMDSVELDSELYYDMGIAYQNLLQEESAIECYQKALEQSPNNKAYNFVLAKSYYNDGMYDLAEPFFKKLCDMDSLNWAYAYHLTSIYMQQERYDDAIAVYTKLWNSDPQNFDYLNRIGYATMKKGEHDQAMEIFYKALGIEEQNVAAMRNLAYIYTMRGEYDTALVLLGEGIKIEPENKAILNSRAEINFALNYKKRAMDDYLSILAMGDTTVMYLKRIGIGYSYNLQFDLAAEFFERALLLDPKDYEICAYLGQAYQKEDEYEKSEYYYNMEIDLLYPMQRQMLSTMGTLASMQLAEEDISKALDNYKKSLNSSFNLSTIMQIANIYDAKLNDRENAIKYYEMFLDEDHFRDLNIHIYPDSYIESVQARLDYLKRQK